jgi:hypothetical protein
MPIRLQNLLTLEFERHLFIRTGRGAKSTLELSSAEVKNNIDLAFEIPPQVVKMLVEYRDRVMPKIIGEIPTRLFVNVDGTPKEEKGLGVLITKYARRRAGITLTPHQTRHLSAKVLLDDQPGGFEIVRQLLGHRNLHQTHSSSICPRNHRHASMRRQRRFPSTVQVFYFAYAAHPIPCMGQLRFSPSSMKWRTLVAVPAGNVSMNMAARNHCSRPMTRDLHGHNVCPETQPCPDSIFKSNRVESSV